jgi:DnaJ domain
VERRRLDAFRLLGIPAGSDRETVAHAYRRLARATHPDVSRDPKTADRFAILTEAYRLATEEPPPPVAPASPASSARPAPASGGVERGEEWRAPTWAMVRAVTLPSSGDVPGHGPPLVAGPVLIRPPGAAPGRGARDG